ncbi:MAG: Gfo/Idh/MocA family oxidoreductase [Nitrospirae bacterium]|nr:Gfo/Idh/MocA family oxidoreductase [Nitrospirota bacterium]
MGLREEARLIKEMIKVGVVGVGSIGSQHARIYGGLKGVRLVSVADTDSSRAQEVASRYNCRAYNNYLQMMEDVDAVSIAVPTTMHYKIGVDFLKNDKDVLIEKPMTSDIKEADKLISEAQKKGKILQVGHLERFNAGVSLISSMVEKPRFIESQRLSPFLRRGTDVDVTLDLMIHDIDIILSLVHSEISDLRATGARVLTDNIDISHAWIEFKNGCIAEVAASRVSSQKLRQLKVFQHNSYLSLDYQTQEVLCYRKVNNKVKKEIKKPREEEPLKEQLISFIDCVRNRTKPVVSGLEGKEALKVALRISEEIRNRM